jgi:hypothetical protein
LEWFAVAVRLTIFFFGLFALGEYQSDFLRSSLRVLEYLVDLDWLAHPTTGINIVAASTARGHTPRFFCGIADSGGTLFSIVTFSNSLGRDASRNNPDRVFRNTYLAREKLLGP